MTTTHSSWVPKLGEIAWIDEEVDIPQEFKQQTPDHVPGHFPLVIHITPGDDAKTRYVWFLLLHSTKGNSAVEDSNVHFQYKYVSKQRTSIAEHNLVKCDSNCKKFLFLQPTKTMPTPMNTAGYVDIGKVHELPLSCLRQKHGLDWHLRNCSFDMITEKVKDRVADRVTQWKPRQETGLLSQKLGSSLLKIADLVCWVNPASGKLVDSNGITYTGCGPCVMTLTDSGTARICVILDKRIHQEFSNRFIDIKADPDIVTESVFPAGAIEVTKQTRLIFILPKDTHRTTCVSSQHLVLEPTFEVSTNELYELPRCYLPIGSQACTRSISAVDAYALTISPRIAECADTRQAKEAERRRLEAERKLQCQKENGEQDYEELLQKTETGIKKTKDFALSLLTVVGKQRMMGMHNQGPGQVSNTIKWLENYLLMCIAMASLKQEGALLRADDDEMKSPEQQSRSDLAEAIDKMLTGLSDHPPQSLSGVALREAIGTTASQCDPFVCMMNPSLWPTFETFMPKGIASKESLQRTPDVIEDVKESLPTESSSSPSCPFL